MHNRAPKQLIPVLLLSILIIFLLTACFGSSKNQSSTTQPSGNQAVTGTVGQPLRVGDAEWTVLNVSKQPALGEGSDQPNGVFVVVNLNVKNLANTEQNVEGIEHELKVKDSQGRETSQTEKIIIPPEGWPERIMANQLGGGAQITGYAVFDVPADASGLNLEVYGWALKEDQTGSIALGI